MPLFSKLSRGFFSMDGSTGDADGGGATSKPTQQQVQQNLSGNVHLRPSGNYALGVETSSFSRLLGENDNDESSDFVDFDQGGGGGGRGEAVSKQEVEQQKSDHEMQERDVDMVKHESQSDDGAGFEGPNPVSDNDTIAHEQEHGIGNQEHSMKEVEGQDTSKTTVMDAPETVQRFKSEPGLEEQQNVPLHPDVIGHRQGHATLSQLGVEHQQTQSRRGYDATSNYRTPATNQRNAQHLPRMRGASENVMHYSQPIATGRYGGQGQEAVQNVSEENSGYFQRKPMRDSASYGHSERHRQPEPLLDYFQYRYPGNFTFETQQTSQHPVGNAPRDHRPGSASNAPIHSRQSEAIAARNGQGWFPNQHFERTRGLHQIPSVGQHQMDIGHTPMPPLMDRRMSKPDATFNPDYFPDYPYAQFHGHMPMIDPYQQGSFSQPPPQLSHGYNVEGRPYTSPDMSSQSLGKRKAEEHPEPPVADEDEGNSSEDDEPLMSRTQRQPSYNGGGAVAADSTFGYLSRERSETWDHEEQLGDNIHPKDSAAPGLVKIDDTSKSHPHLIIKPPTRLPGPQRTNPKSKTQKKQHPEPEPSSSPEPISFKLPTFKVTPQPLKCSHDDASVKISLPGLYREELLLAADHVTNEQRLLNEVFLPGQKALAQPDPQPEVAAMNFHTVAVMVLDAYYKYFSPDLLTIQARRMANASSEDSGDDEVRAEDFDATTADTDEIFFATIDRWRVGLSVTTGEQPYTLIRGIQEFCDLALEIIYYIKENGLIPELGKPRKQRKDKGQKRGSNVKVKEKEVEKKRGPGRPEATESIRNKGTARPKKEEMQKKKITKGKDVVNVLQPRKKAKTETKPKIGKITVMKGKSGRK